MNNRTHESLGRYASMETQHLLLRYRAGGLLPEAEAALREVLADRGYAGAALTEKMTTLDAPATVQAAPPQPVRIIIKSSHPDLRKLTLALRLLVIPVLIIFLLLAIPILGNVIVLGGASALGCSTGENMVHPCHFLYWDIGDFVYGYIVDIFLLGGFNPFLSALAFTAFVRSLPGAAWMATVIGVFAAREVKRHRLRQQGRRALLKQDEASDNSHG